jgi:hypothetical protein
MPGKVGTGALWFHLSFIEVLPSPDLDFTSDFSIDAWIRVNDCGSSGSGNPAPIVDKWDPITQTGFSFFVDQPSPGTGFLKLQLNNALFTSAASLPTSGAPLTNTGPWANIGPWVHVAVTVDRTAGVGTFYINGSPAGSFAPPSGGITNALPLWIGEIRVPGVRCPIAIDELELFNRALTPQEVQALYAADSAGKCRCAMVSDGSIVCQTNGTFSYTATLTNGSSAVVTGIQLIAPAGITVTPASIPTTLSPGQSITGTVTLGGSNAVPGATVCLQVVLTTQGKVVCEVPHCITLPDCAGQPCFQPPSGMVAWWPLDDATNQTAVLELVGAHQGVTRNSAGTVTPIGTPGLWSLPGPALPGVLPVVVDPATSPPRGALLISSAYVEVPHHPALNIGSNGWTVTLWAWPSPGSGASQPLMEKFDVATTNGYSLYLEALGGGLFQLKLNLNGAIVAGPTFTASSTGSDWRFITARVSAAGQVELGVCDMAGNCTNSPAVTISNFVTTDTAPLWLGRSLAVTGGAAVLYAVRVALDEVEMFDRALTASELQSIYNAEVAGGRKCEPSSGVAELCVVKFEDLNGDGVPDAGEPGLAGWSFVVSPAPLGLGTNVVTTLKDGGICFAVSAPGTYTIAELGQPGWTPTTLSTQVVTVVPGQPVQVIFGNQRTGLVEICGMKFLDADGDGKLGTGEPGLANWVIEVLDASGNVVGQAVTDTNGQYCIAVPPGTYTVSEQQQSGWVATTPASVTVTVPPAALNVNFGNRRAVGEVCVLKFHDLNQNGVRDAGEPALPGWTIQIKDSAGNVIQSIVTATNPVCVSVPSGVYQVSEVLPPPIGVWLPWTPTVPPSGTYSNVTVLPGQSVTLMFGNRKMIKVFNPVLVPSPLRVILRMTAEPGEWYQLQYSETLGEGAVWRDWGDPVQATEPEVRFEVPVTSDQRQLYFRGIEKKDIRRGF